MPRQETLATSGMAGVGWLFQGDQGTRQLLSEKETGLIIISPLSLRHGNVRSLIMQQATSAEK